MQKHKILAVVCGIFALCLFGHCMLTHSVGIGALGVFMVILTIINIIKSS